MVKYFVITCLVFILSGCVTNRGMHDSSIPIEEQATLEIDWTLTVVEFNGLNVNWRAGTWARNIGFSSRAVIVIPAGEHTLIANYNQNIGTSGRSWADGLRITHVFQPGITYRLSPYISGRTVRLNIKESKD